MKKIIYALAFSGLFVLNLNAQTTYSFEASEGYTLGNLHEQNGWEVTEGLDGFLQNQIISDEQASDGSFSFFNGYESNFDFQWFPIFGAAKEFDAPMPSEDFTISYDVMVTGKMGADFEFTLYTVINEEFYLVASLGMEYQGGIYMISELAGENGAYEKVENIWTENEWVPIKIEFVEKTVNFYAKGELLQTFELNDQPEIYGFNMLHNNYGNSAYYDNIKINGGNLYVQEVETNLVSLYPNPTNDFFTVQSSEKVVSVQVYSVTGQKVLSSKNSEKINVSALNAGVYFVEIKTVDGKLTTKKIIKK